jgi:prepilin-type N-terminal cleavage/methylation domain-containing protein
MKMPFRIRVKIWNSNGFTLLEALVAMLVLAVGILGLAPMLVVSMQGNQSSREVSEAAYLVQDRIEQFRDQATISPIPFNETVTIGHYSRVVNVIDQSVDNTIPLGVYQITVTINWTGKEGKSHSTSYLTYKTK